MAMISSRFGKLFYVIGPSGSGKDSLMRYARSHLAAKKKIIFVHRYITRPPEVQGENHIYLSEEEFENRKNQGFFSMYWESHGFCYGIGNEINYWLANGYNIVMNGSRAYFREALKAYPKMTGIMVSTSTTVLRERLLKRNRESSEEIAKRLSRAQLFCDIDHPQLLKLNNDVELAQSGTALINILTDFRANQPSEYIQQKPVNDSLQVRFLGTGNAPGVPVRGCTCEVCIRANSITSYRREPCAAVVEIGTKKILIDAGIPDLKNRFSEDSLTAILLTHYHPDHVQGLFPFRWGGWGKIDTFSPVDQNGCGDLYKNPGILNFKHVNPYEAFDIAGIKIIPVSLVHSKPTLGYCFEHKSGKIAYLTDTIGLPEKTSVFLQNWKPDLVILDCSYPPSECAPINHNDITMALKIFTDIKPKRMLFTHIGHKLDQWLNDHYHELPRGVGIAQDNDVVALHETGHCDIDRSRWNFLPLRNQSL
jgi:phosphoribosyl 1,2-cyclic phosphate phosphodiesterase